MKTIKTIILTCCAVVLLTGISYAQSDSTILIKTSAQCGDCKQRIENNLSFEKGVKKATLDLKTKIATVVYDPKKTSSEKIRTVIAKTGYDADDVLADEKKYKKLPKCCQKGGH